MVYGIVKLINFAHGDIIMVGSYMALVALVSWGMPLPAAIIFAVLACVLLGVTIEATAYRPLRQSPKISLLITALGVSMLLQNLAQLIFTSNPRPFPQILPRFMVKIGSFEIGFISLVTICASIVLMVALTLLVNKTKAGKAMRAVSEDADAARLMGINVNSTITFTFAIGSMLAGIGAVLYCSAYPQVAPTMGSLLGLKAFIAAVLGGIGSIPGAMVGGFIIGLAESLTKGYISSQLADAVVFGILIVVLFIKPGGLLGKQKNEKV